MDAPGSDRDRTGTPPADPSLDRGERVPFKLPALERERLAWELLSSLESELEFEAEWIEEVERRAREIDEGTVDTIPADQVIREALDRLK